MIIRSAYPDIAVPEVCLPEFLFAELGTDDTDRPAVIDSSHRGYTYGQLTAAIGRVAAVKPSAVWAAMTWPSSSPPTARSAPRSSMAC